MKVAFASMATAGWAEAGACDGAIGEDVGTRPGGAVVLLGVEAGHGTIALPAAAEAAYTG